MSSPIYFDFLAAVWNQFPDEERELYGELWKGYEQVIAAVYQKYIELSLNISVGDMRAWTVERWMPYTFSSAAALLRPATLTSNQDLSIGYNATTRNLLGMSVNGGTPFEVDIRGENPAKTNIDEIILRINIGAGFRFASGVTSNSLLKLSSNISGPNSSITILPASNPLAEACEFVLGVDPKDLPASYPLFSYPYSIPYRNVKGIPWFRDAVRDETMVTELKEGIDFIVEENTVAFKVRPPVSMWAEETNIDEENPWSNFGYLTEIYQKNSTRYVEVLRGLWFALWNGPKPQNIKISLYLLFGLPTSPEIGTVTSVTSSQISILGASGKSYVLNIPNDLNAIVATGDRLYEFQPLVDGINVFDKVNYPGFVAEEIGREGITRFLTEDATRGFGDTDETKALTLLEEHTYLPQISVDAFIYPDINLGSIKTFLSSFRPLSKAFMFQIILGAFREHVGLIDPIALGIDFFLDSNLDANETTDLNQTLLNAYESNLVVSDVFYPEGAYLDPAGVAFDEKVELEVQEYGIFKDSFVL